MDRIDLSCTKNGKESTNVMGGRRTSCGTARIEQLGPSVTQPEADAPTLQYISGQSLSFSISPLPESTFPVKKHDRQT